MKNLLLEFEGGIRVSTYKLPVSNVKDEMNTAQFVSKFSLV